MSALEPNRGNGPVATAIWCIERAGPALISVALGVRTFLWGSEGHIDVLHWFLLLLGALAVMGGAIGFLGWLGRRERATRRPSPKQGWDIALSVSFHCAVASAVAGISCGIYALVQGVWPAILIAAGGVVLSMAFLSLSYWMIERRHS